MKLSFILCLATFLQVSASSMAQKISLDKTNAALKDVLNDIHNQSGYSVLYDAKLLKDIKVTIHVNNASLDEALKDCFKNQLLGYVINNKTIVITPINKPIVNPVQSVLPVTIKGTVTDEKGVALSGVTVTLKPSMKRTSTDLGGNYSIAVDDPANSTLMFTYVSFKVQEISTAGKTTIDVKLISSNTDLTEVVVTALNIPREKRSIGVAQQSINVSDMTEARATNITDLLDGKVAGLQLTTSGQSTGSTRVVIRGMGSITGDNQPLWVVDGVPIDNYDGQTTNGQGIGSQNNLDYGNGASALNPDDIQSIEVLKGPNAAALYGSRAANGAILVTTKKGKKNDGVGVSLNENFMVGRILQFPDFQNIYGEGGSNSLYANPLNAQNVVQEGSTQRSWGGVMLGQPYATFSGAPTTYSPHPDNVTSLYQSAYTLTQNFAISNATDNSAIRFSYTRIDANDVMQKQNLQQRNNFAFNASKDFTKFLRIETRLQYAQSNVQNRVARNEDAANPMNVYNNLPRSVGPNDFMPYKDPAGNEFLAGNIGFENPLWLINENYNQDNTNTIIGGITATLKLLPGLSFRAQIATNLIWGGRQVFLQKGAASNAAGKLGYYSEFQQNNKNWNSEGLFIYNKQFGKFSVVADLGGNIRTLNYYNATSIATSLLGHDIMNLANNASVPSSSESLVRSQTNSLYGTFSVGYNSYLYLDVTGRNDWSSTLPAANRSFFYPSASMSYVFSDFFKIPEDIMSLGKLRASIAQVGNDTSPYNLINAFNNNGVVNGTTLLSFENKLKNSNLKPEKTTSVELGLEMRFLKDRISVDASVYRKNTTNQILTGNISQASGFNSEVINAGSVSNKGFELTLTAVPVRSSNFEWDLIGNFAVNRNMVNSLIPGLNQFQIGGALLTSEYAEVGKPIGVLRGEDWMHDANGNLLVFAGQGIPISQSTPYTTDGKALAYLGNFQPNSIESFGSTFKYKDFDLNFLISARMGGQIFSGSYWRADQNGVTLETLPGRDNYEFSNVVLGEGGLATQKDQTSLYGLAYPGASRSKGPLFNGYAPQTDAKGNIIYDSNGLPMANLKAPNVWYLGPQTYYQRYYHINSLMTFDDSFIKLSQVIIGYNIPRKFISKTLFRSARFSLVGRNLWTILQHTPRGIDPESANSSGNAQGLELGGSLPYTYYGADLKFSF
ncbi:MAG: SusC/RagA family TonB-linked outer membrane protein [Mucilaginibacter sp.]|nr:SusC/RagA family TonB-linked outer membrane protein [Mucilaginibacter sp.]